VRRAAAAGGDRARGVLDRGRVLAVQREGREAEGVGRRLAAHRLDQGHGAGLVARGQEPRHPIGLIHHAQHSTRAGARRAICRAAGDPKTRRAAVSGSPRIGTGAVRYQLVTQFTAAAPAL
jgi:hypothetical protein